MSRLNKKYPDNHEVAAFYALSLLGSVPMDVMTRPTEKEPTLLTAY